MIKDLREKLKKLFEGFHTTEFRLDAACLTACKAVGASSASILLYSSREDKLRCSGRYIDEKIGKADTGGNDVLFEVLKHIYACEYIYKLKETPSVENDSQIFDDFNRNILIENYITADEFITLVENFEEWKEWYEKLKEEYHRECFTTGINTDTVTGEWYKRLHLKEKGIPGDILIINLDDVEEEKKYYCMKNLEEELRLTFKSQYYVALPLGGGGRDFGVLRFLLPKENRFIKSCDGDMKLGAQEKEFFEDMAYSFSLHMEINQFMKRMEIARTMHKEFSDIFNEEGRNTHEYVDEFLRTISYTIEKLEIFPHHIIWECIGETLPGNMGVEDKYLLRIITNKEDKNNPLKSNDFLKCSLTEYISPPFPGKEFTDKIINYFNVGKLEQIFDLPISEGFSYCNLPIYSKSTSGENDLVPTWIFTLIYREEDKGLIGSEDFFRFMEFFSDQLSLGWDKFGESIANKIHNKIDDEINAGDKAKSLSDKDALEIISSALAKEFQADICAFFLLDEQKNKMRPVSSNIDLSSKKNKESANGANAAEPCFKENKTLRFIGRENLADFANMKILGALEDKIKSIEHCMCIPIFIGKTKKGTMTLFRSKAIKSQNPGKASTSMSPPFSECETNLLKKVQGHIFDTIISYFNLQQRMKDMRNVIEQVTSPIKSLVGHTEEIIKGRVRKEKILGKVGNMNKLAKISLKYAANFEKLLELDSKQVNLKKERLYDLRDYLIGISIEYQPLIRKKCISIRVKDLTPNNVNLYADKELIYHAIANIIDNAVKYSFFPEERERFSLQAKPRNHEDKENVLITAQEENNSVIIMISSYGLEILEDEKDKIFDKEFRGVKAIERFNVGAGIGLYIARKILELHNGKIELVPKTEKYNTVFKITLPKEEVAR